MKKFMTAAALATVLVSPAFAQAYYPDAGSGNIVRAPGSYAVTSQQRVGPAIAPEFRGAYAQARGWANPATVYANGEYRGQDPDPSVQLDLVRNSGGAAH
jgi:hypothetical protein